MNKGRQCGPKKLLLSSRQLTMQASSRSCWAWRESMGCGRRRTRDPQHWKWATRATHMQMSAFHTTKMALTEDPWARLTRGGRWTWRMEAESPSRFRPNCACEEKGENKFHHHESSLNTPCTFDLKKKRRRRRNTYTLQWLKPEAPWALVTASGCLRYDEFGVILPRFLFSIFRFLQNVWLGLCRGSGWARLKNASSCWCWESYYLAQPSLRSQVFRILWATTLFSSFPSVLFPQPGAVPIEQLQNWKELY